MSEFLLVIGGGPLGIALKCTVILALAGIATLCLWKASAAIRHLIWFAALGGCVVLAVLSPVAPRVGVPVTPRPIFLDEAGAPATMFAVPRHGFAYASGTEALRRIEAQIGPNVIVTGSAAFEGIDRSPSFRERLSSWSEGAGTPTLVGVWLLGVLFILGRCAIGHLAVRRIINRAQTLASPVWDSALLEAAEATGAPRNVELLQSEDLTAPVTSGFFNPVVIVPADAYLWSTERRYIVLLHELAHVARVDYLAQMVATFATALFWFHPLVWFANARLRAEAENAADDRVLGAGMTGVTYASHLLELARLESGLHVSATVAVGMVRQSRLEGRFRAMLDTTRSRSGVSRRLQALATSMTFAAMVPLAGARAVMNDEPAIVVRVTPGETVERLVESQIETAETIEASNVAKIDDERARRAAVIESMIGDSTIDRLIDAKAGERLMLELETGGSVVLHGWDEPRIRLRATLGGVDWADTRITLERMNGGVNLRSDFSYRANNRSTKHSFELWVPKHINVELSSSGGSLRISDLTGEFRGHTGGGSIVIERASGHASLETGGGEVRVTDSDLGGRVSTGGGGVTIANVTGGLQGTSGSGPVVSYGEGSAVGVGGIAGTRAGFGSAIGAGVGSGTTTVISGRTGTVIGGGVAGYVRAGDRGVAVTSGSTTTTITDGELRGMTTTRGVTRGSVGGDGYSYSKAGGDIEIAEVPRGGKLSTGGGRVYVGSSSGFLGISTGGGEVVLPRVGGDVSAWTGAGNVSITVVNTDGTEHSVDVFTGRGRVVLELPATLDATFELESAYTEGAARRTSIESDFPLDISESPTWDDREGSPRKYVRGRGVVGSGKGLIRIRAVNGDIIVRRK